VDFSWERNNQGRLNATQYLMVYRQVLRRSYPDVVFSDVHASKDRLKCAAIATFHVGKTAVRGRYYVESSPRSVSAQGYFGPSAIFASQRGLLVNIMASIAFINNDPRPERAVLQKEYYHPEVVQRAADDGSLAVKVPGDWIFAGGGKISCGKQAWCSRIHFTYFKNPMVRNVPITMGVISARCQIHRKPWHMFYGVWSSELISAVPDAAVQNILPASGGISGHNRILDFLQRDAVCRRFQGHQLIAFHVWTGELSFRGLGLKRSYLSGCPGRNSFLLLNQ
jgi:hypothetical protein